MFDLVIKIGGSLLVQDENLRRFSKDITSVQKNYPHFKILIVHGGGPYIKEELDRAKIKFEFVDGQRVTSKEM
ncbi:MAG: acetylglutamate kinase, partial [Bacteriovoracaceae bacterium]